MGSGGTLDFQCSPPSNPTLNMTKYRKHDSPKMQMSCKIETLLLFIFAPASIVYPHPKYLGNSEPDNFDYRKPQQPRQFSSCWSSSAQKEGACMGIIQAPVIPGNHLLSPRRTTIGRTVLASEFGMGSGVSPSVRSPGNLG